LNTIRRLVTNRRPPTSLPVCKQPTILVNLTCSPFAKSSLLPVSTSPSYPAWSLTRSRLGLSQHALAVPDESAACHYGSSRQHRSSSFPIPAIPCVRSIVRGQPRSTRWRASRRVSPAMFACLIAPWCRFRVFPLERTRRQTPVPIRMTNWGRERIRAG
jgi:hypothetical protein